MYYIYVLKSKKDKGWYIGLTTNLEGRLRDHNFGKTRSTKSRRPLEIIYSEKFQNKIEAESAEKYYKSGAGRIKLKKLINKKLK